MMMMMTMETHASSFAAAATSVIRCTTTRRPLPLPLLPLHAAHSARCSMLRVSSCVSVSAGQRVPFSSLG